MWCLGDDLLADAGANAMTVTKITMSLNRGQDVVCVTFPLSHAVCSTVLMGRDGDGFCISDMSERRQQIALVLTLPSVDQLEGRLGLVIEVQAKKRENLLCDSSKMLVLGSFHKLLLIIMLLLLLLLLLLHRTSLLLKRGNMLRYGGLIR